MAECSSHPHFLTLPLELREQVYRDVILTSDSNVQILRGCRQIHAEAQQFVFKRPLAFDSQTELCQWLNRVDKRYLRHIDTLRFSVVEIDLSPLLETSYYSPSTRLHWWDLYEMEAKELSAALQSLSNVRDLTISLPGSVDSRLVRDFYHALLDNLAHIFPKLEHLTLPGGQRSLEFVEPMRCLHSLRFNGYTDSRPIEPANVLSRMPHLTELQLFGPPYDMVDERFRGDKRPQGAQPLSPEVLHHIRPLTSFAIFEEDRPWLEKPVYFNPPFLQALRSAHITSLKKLCISLDWTPDQDAQDLLFALLSDSVVRDLTICWPGLDPSFLLCLPASLETLRTSVSGALDAYSLVCWVSHRKTDLAVLEEIELMADRTQPETDRDPSEVVPSTLRPFGRISADELQDAYLGRRMSHELEPAIDFLRGMGYRARQGSCTPGLFDEGKKPMSR
ncbi:hypothetical protein B0A49_09933 [Cryomyces minteri]|uniref:Uncharacterized protein n=1 Tax=Cryomyces minteri TaxID=331657 RepID=A0A4U0WT35_9PEZI|nr:hypothetical protein B0A49_09933 [Cryomyces minteri]